MGKRVIVIGCGIGGPAAALALRRAGFEPVVYEAHDGSADHVGSFLNLASNGLDALQTLGVAHTIRTEGFPTPRMVMWSATGKRLGEVANGRTLPDGTESITIRRGLLHRVLRDEVARRAIRLETGKAFVSAEESRGRVVARFEDGSEAAGDLLVGADGIHSRVRRFVDPDCPPPRYTGQLSIGGIAPTSDVPATAGAYHMIFGRRAFFGYAVRSSGEAYWFANVADPQATQRASLATASAEDWKRRLMDLFRGDAGPAVRMIEGTPEEQLAAFPVYDMPTVPTWHRGSVVLLGDAIHATSPSAGQGASLAVEDALVLAKCLRDAPDGEAAFEAYESLRRERVERVVRYSKRVGSTKVAGAVGRFFRDLIMPLALRLYDGSSAHDWLYAHHVEWGGEDALARVAGAER